MTENTCVCCGQIIPEGRMVCNKCENAVANYQQYILPARQYGKDYVIRMVEEWKKLIASKN